MATGTIRALRDVAGMRRGDIREGVEIDDRTIKRAAAGSIEILQSAGDVETFTPDPPDPDVDPLARWTGEASDEELQGPAHELQDGEDGPAPVADDPGEGEIGSQAI